jgi:toxin ParE1/3/4
VIRAQFVEAARLEFLHRVAYYEGEEQGLGGRYAASVEDAAARALAFPSAGSPAASGTRRMLVKDFPFAIIYRPNDDGIVIFAVAHHARRPGYWQARTEQA